MIAETVPHSIQRLAVGLQARDLLGHGSRLPPRLTRREHTNVLRSNLNFFVKSIVLCFLEGCVNYGGVIAKAHK